MGYTGKNTASTVCPFYIREGEKRIVCEGIEPDTEICRHFVTTLQKESFQEENCCKEGCCLTKMIEAKYRG